MMIDRITAIMGRVRLKRSHNRYLANAALAAAIAIFIFIIFMLPRLGAIYSYNLHPRAGAAAALIAVSVIVLAARPIGLPRMTTRHWALSVGAITLSLLALALATRHLIFHRYLTDDEFVYQFQAHTYLSGRLWNPAPPLASALSANFIGISGSKWFGMYPPGWPLVLALSDLLRLPPDVLISAMLIAMIVITSKLLLRRAGRFLSILGTSLVAAAPFTILNGASLYSHTECCVLALLAVWSADKAFRDRGCLWAVCAGIALGALFLSRTLSAIAVAAPIGVALLCSTHRVRLGIAVAVGGAPFAIGLLVYQRLLTGSALRSPYWLAGRSVDHLYFDPASVVKGLSLTVTRLAELSLWTAPLIVVLLVAALISKWRNGHLEFIDFIFPTAVGAYVFYPMSPSFQYGPRYLFEFWPLAVFTIVTGVARAKPDIRAYSRSVLLLCFAYTIYLFPFIGIDYLGLIGQKASASEQFRPLPPGRAIVCIRARSKTGLSGTSGDFARNDIDASAQVLLARCELASPAALRAAYPDRTVWIYDVPPGESRERLTLYSKPISDIGLGVRKDSNTGSTDGANHFSAAPAPRNTGVLALISSWIIAVISRAGYFGVASLMAVESACIPLPSEIIMPFAGYLASIGKLNLLAVATAGAIGCNIGSMFAYFAGAYGGRPFVEHWGRWLLVSTGDLERAERFFARYGAFAVLVGRMLPVVRTFIAFPAGVARMNLARFHLYTFIGSWPWCFALAIVGKMLGGAWQTSPGLRTVLHALDGVVVAAILIAIGVFVWFRLRTNIKSRSV